MSCTLYPPRKHATDTRLPLYGANALIIVVLVRVFVHHVAAAVFCRTFVCVEKKLLTNDWWLKVMWQFHRGCQFFTARRYASAVFAVVVCSSVCLSVTSRYCIIVSKRLYGSNWFLSWRLSITYAIQKRCCKKIRVSLKVRLLISGTVSQTLDLENFATASRSRCQQNSSTVQLVDDTYDARRVVAGRREFIQSEQNRKQKGKEYTRHTNTKIFK